MSADTTNKAGPESFRRPPQGIQARIITKARPRRPPDAQLSAPALHLPTPRATDRVE